MCFCGNCFKFLILEERKEEEEKDKKGVEKE